MARAPADNVEARIAALGNGSRRAVPPAAAGFLPHINVAQDWRRGVAPSSSSARCWRSDASRPATSPSTGSTTRRRSATSYRITIEQRLFDGGATLARLRSARLGRDLKGAERARTTRRAGARRDAPYRAVCCRRGDPRRHAGLKRPPPISPAATARRDAGLVADADMLALEVQRARMQEARIRATAGARVRAPF